MPLLDLQTEYKSLKFSSDQPGDGYSGLPYVQFPIDTDSTQEPFKGYYKSNRASLDFPIRGGAIDFDLREITTTPASNFDKERIAKFLKDTPRGDLFIKEQIGLQLSNPKIQTADAIPSFKLTDLPGTIENTRIFNLGRNLLTQIGFSGTGTHANRAGLLPMNPIEKFYSDIVGAEKNLSTKDAQETNRLLILQQLKMKTGTTSNQYISVDEVANIDKVNKLGISLNRDVLFEYLGGPGSVYGLGFTTIKRATDADTTKVGNDPIFKGSNILQNALTMNYDTIMNQSANNYGPDKRYSDFRDKLSNNGKSVKRLVGSNWGDDKNQRIDVRFFDTNGVDKINAIGSQDYDGSGQDPMTNPDNDDLIKFNFECLSNDDPTKSTFLFFRAYLTNITDNNNATWNSFKYLGRGENFYVYQGFERSITFTFKIVIGSREELDTAHEKLQYLISQTYPDYAPLGVNYMRGSITKLTIGDYLYKMPGILETVNVTIDANSTWEITDTKQKPHFMDVSITFKPIFNDLPKRNIINSSDPVLTPKVTQVDLITNTQTLDPRNGEQYTYPVIGPNGEIIEERIVKFDGDQKVLEYIPESDWNAKYGSIASTIRPLNIQI